MFQDIGVSKDLNELFKKHVVTSNEPLDIDFGIQVLSSGSWPFQQTFTFLLPSEVKFVYFLKVFYTYFFILAGTMHQPLYHFLQFSAQWSKATLVV